jgi:hypothetical protein
VATPAAAQAYVSGIAGDLAFAKGDTVEITSIGPGRGWWTGICGGATGIFPANHVRPAGFTRCARGPRVLNMPTEASRCIFDAPPFPPRLQVRLRTGVPFRLEQDEKSWYPDGWVAALCCEEGGGGGGEVVRWQPRVTAPPSCRSAKKPRLTCCASPHPKVEQ